MGAVAGRVVAVLLLAASVDGVMLVDDSPVPQARAELPAPALGAPEGRPPGRQTYSEGKAVVPFGRASLELPILLYHYIRVPPSPRHDLIGYNLSVSPLQFAAQMDWLAAHGYHTITFVDLRLYWQRVKPLPSRPVIITLDDGYQDLYTAAFPILASHGFTAVAYIVSGFVGHRGYVTETQILQMDGYGIEIGAHTVNHADLTQASQPWMAYELVQSKAWLEKLVGHSVSDMAYPSGKYNAPVIADVERAGYYSAVTEDLTYVHTQADRYMWGRVRVAAGESMSMFISGLGPTMSTGTINTVLVQPTPAPMQSRP